MSIRTFETTSPNHVMSDGSNIWPVQTMSCRAIQIFDQSKPSHVSGFKYLTSPNHVMSADSNIWPVQTMSCWWIQYPTSPNHVMLADSIIWPVKKQWWRKILVCYPKRPWGKYLVTNDLLNKLNPNPRANHCVCQAYLCVFFKDKNLLSKTKRLKPIHSK